MKQFILILVTIITLTPSFAQWPGVNYHYAKMYLTNVDSEFTKPLLPVYNGKLEDNVMQPGVVISAEQANKAVVLANSNMDGLLQGLSKTFFPHHAIVFFNQNNTPVAWISIGFECEGIKLYPERKYKPAKKELPQSEIERLEKILAQFKTIFEQSGVPVYKNNESYFKLGTQQLQLKYANSFFQILKTEHPDSDKRFDLSGLLYWNNQILAIADKKWNNKIYRIDTANRSFTLNNAYVFTDSIEIDIEGIDMDAHNFILIEETGTRIILINKTTGKKTFLPVSWQKSGADLNEWGPKNKGLEGLAVDSTNGIIYFMKEREPRRIYAYHCERDSFFFPFDGIIDPKIENNDISDAKFENNCLYLLERASQTVKKINLTTLESQSVSFKKWETVNGQLIYESEYHMAEALTLTPTEIWIGFDNNNDEVTKAGLQNGLREGNQSVIFVFKRPEGF